MRSPRRSSGSGSQSSTESNSITISMLIEVHGRWTAYHHFITRLAQKAKLAPIDAEQPDQLIVAISHCNRLVNNLLELPLTHTRQIKKQVVRITQQLLTIATTRCNDDYRALTYRTRKPKKTNQLATTLTRLETALQSTLFSITREQVLVPHFTSLAEQEETARASSSTAVEETARESQTREQEDQSADDTAPVSTDASSIHQTRAPSGSHDYEGWPRDQRFRQFTTPNYAPFQAAAPSQSPLSITLDDGETYALARSAIPAVRDDGLPSVPEHLEAPTSTPTASPSRRGSSSRLSRSPTPIPWQPRETLDESSAQFLEQALAATHEQPETQTSLDRTERRPESAPVSALRTQTPHLFGNSGSSTANRVNLTPVITPSVDPGIASSVDEEPQRIVTHPGIPEGAIKPSPVSTPSTPTRELLFFKDIPRCWIEDADPPEADTRKYKAISQL